MAQTYDLMASATADGSSDTIQFDSIPQTYDNLHFFLSVRSTNTANSQTDLKVTPQTSSAWSANLAAYFTNYVSQQDSSNYSSSTGTDNINVIVRLPNADTSGNYGSAAEYFGCYRIDFPEYSLDGQNKAFYMYGGTTTPATYFGSSMQACGNVRVVAPFVQVTFEVNNGNFVSGSRIRMYGTSNS